MISIRVTTEGLAKWSQRLSGVAGDVKRASVKSLNYVGEQVRNELAQSLAEETGLDVDAVRARLQVQKASGDTATFSITAAASLLDDVPSRPLPGRRRRVAPSSGKYFREGELVKIVTMEDERVCHLCEALAEGSPYTIEDARAQIPHHPNCRCTVQPFYGTRRTLPVEVKRGARARAEVKDMTLKQLAAQLRGEIKVVLKLRK